MFKLFKPHNLVHTSRKKFFNKKSMFTCNVAILLLCLLMTQAFKPTMMLSVDTFERDIHRRIHHHYSAELTTTVAQLIKSHPCQDTSFDQKQINMRIQALSEVIPSELKKFESKVPYFSARLRYHELLFSFFEKVATIVPQFISKNSSVIDVGCGTGLSTTYLIRSLHPSSRVLAVDKDPFMVALSKVSHHSRNFINYNMESVYDHFLEDHELRRVVYKLVNFFHFESFPKTFSHINMNFVLDGVHAFETMKMLRTAKTLLKPKGYLTLLQHKEPGTEYTYLISPHMEEILYSIGFLKVKRIIFDDTFPDFEGFVAIM